MTSPPPPIPSADATSALGLTALDALVANVAVLDRDGVILFVNEAWRRFGRENGGTGPSAGVGADYLAVCRDARGPFAEGAAAHDGIRAVLDGARPRFDLEYPCPAADRPRWFQLTATPLGPPGGAVVAHTDVTDRRLAERSARINEERLQLAAEAAGLGAFGHDFRTGESYRSAEVKTLFGLAPDAPFETDADGVPVLTHPDDRAGLVAAVRAALAPNAHPDHEFEHRIVRAGDGAVRWVLVRGRTRFEGTGAGRRPVRFDGVVMDVTDRREAEAAARAGERQFQELAERLPLLVWTCRADGWCDYISPQWLAYTGADEASQLGNGWLDGVHPEDRGRVAEAWGRAVPAGGLYEVDFRLRRADGEYRWFQTRAVPVRDAAGAVVKWFGTSTDVHDLKAAQEALRAGERRFRGLADALPQIVWTAGPDAGTTFLNHRWTEYTGLTGAGFDEVQRVIHPDDLPALLAAWEDAQRSGRGYQCEYRLRAAATGEYRWFLARSVPVRGPDGAVTEWYASSTDVDDLKRAEADLRTARAAAERGLAQLRAVVSTMSDGLVVADADGNLLDWNPAALRMHQFESVDEVRRNLATFADAFVLSPPGGPPLAFADWPMGRILRGEAVVNLELQVVRRDTGLELVLEFNGAPVRGPDGAVELVVLTLHDVTARRRAEAEQRRTQGLFQAVTDGTTDAVFIKDTAGRYLLINPAACRYVGLPASAVLGRDDLAVFGTADAATVMARDRWVMAAGRADTAEETLTAAGVTRTYLASKAPYRDAAGNVIGVIGVSRDITDRKRADDDARRQQDRYRSLVMATAQIVWTADAGGRVVEDSPTWRAFTGQSVEDWLGNGWVAPIHPDDAARAAAAWGRAVAEQGAYESDYRLRRADGEYRRMTARAVPVREPDGAVREWVGTVSDVTDLRAAEEQVRASEERLRLLVEGVQDHALFLVDPDGRVASWNAGAERMYGYTADEAVGLPLAAFYPPQDAPLAARELARAAADGRDEDEGWRVRKGGGRFWANSSAFAIRDADGSVRGYARVVRDLSERKRSEALLAAVLDNVLDGVIGIDARGTVESFNAAAERMFGYAAAEVIGRNVKMLMPEPYRAEHDAYLDNYPPTGAARVIGTGRQVVGRRKDGTTFPVELGVGEFTLDSGRHFTGVVRDITAQRRLEAQFQQAQKMEAVGRLAGGVAHDFNNLLTVINGYAEMLLEALPPDDPLRESVRQISEAGDRAADLTRQLLAFSRQAVLEPKVLDLNAVVRETGALLRRVIGEDVSLTTALAPQLSRVRVDPGQLGQVLMNLAVNARDAMPRGGTLTVETAGVELDADAAAARHGLQPGRYVRLAVSDTGHGMTPEVRAKIFDPFFTTKDKGKGTGLGLAVVYGVVQQSGGAVEVSSEVGIGTTFKVYLPAVDAAPDGVPRGRPAGGPPGGTETVLLVEDEDAVRAVARHNLEALGYTVVEAGSGAAAVAAAAAHPGPIHLLMTDVVMPGLSGPETAAALRAARPDLRVLYLSGYTDDAVFRHGVLEAETAFLQKPFTAHALARKVRAALDRPDPALPPAGPGH